MFQCTFTPVNKDTTLCSLSFSTHDLLKPSPYFSLLKTHHMDKEKPRGGQWFFSLQCNSGGDFFFTNEVRGFYYVSLKQGLLYFSGGKTCLKKKIYPHRA